MTKKLNIKYDDIDFYKSICSVPHYDGKNLEIGVSQITVTNKKGEEQIYENLLFCFQDPIFIKVKTKNEKKEFGDLDTKKKGYDIFLFGADMINGVYIALTIEAKKCTITSLNPQEKEPPQYTRYMLYLKTPQKAANIVRYKARVANLKKRGVKGDKFDKDYNKFLEELTS